MALSSKQRLKRKKKCMGWREEDLTGETFGMENDWELSGSWGIWRDV